MQTSLHWSVKRTSFSLLLIIEFTSCSLEEKWHTAEQKGQQQNQIGANERELWSCSGGLMNGHSQIWARLLVTDIVCSIDVEQVDMLV